jgi:hypothetical protein
MKIRHILGRCKTIDILHRAIGFLSLTYTNYRFVSDIDSNPNHPFRCIIICDPGNNDLSLDKSSEMAKVCRAFLCGCGELVS